MHIILIILGLSIYYKNKLFFMCMINTWDIISHKKKIYNIYHVQFFELYCVDFFKPSNLDKMLFKWYKV